MRGPSAKYLYGRTSTFGTSVNVSQAEIDAVDAEARAEANALKPRRSAKAAALKVAADLLKPADLEAHDGPACGPSCFHPYLTDPTERDVDADLDARREDRGSTCGPNCSFCGACS